MSVEVRSATAYRPRYPVIDVHTHAFREPERFVAMVASRYNPGGAYNFPLFGRGSIEEAETSRAQAGIVKRVIKNFAVKPDKLVAVNDFAIEIALRFPDFIPTGTIHRGFTENEREIERLARAGVRGIAFDSCWQGFHVDDPGLRAAFAMVSAHRMFIIAHAGVDPSGPFKEIETWPDNIKRMKEMAPDSPIIAAHLGANINFGRAREYLGTSGIFFDIAWVKEMCDLGVITQAQILEIVGYLGAEKILYGSDYPWADPGTQLAFWERLFTDDDWRKISHENARRVMGLPG